MFTLKWMATPFISVIFLLAPRCHSTGGPEDKMYPQSSREPFWAPVFGLLQGCSPSRGERSAGTYLVLNKYLLLKCIWDLHFRAMKASFSCHVLTQQQLPGSFLERTLTNSPWQWLLRLQLCPNLFFALQEIKYFPAWHLLKHFFPLFFPCREVYISY